MSPSDGEASGSSSGGLHPVLEVVLERARSGSRPGARSDGFKVGLAVEGGAMRGVVSGGMVAGLEALGLRDSFDAIYGASAGAGAAVYFAAGQAAIGTSIYYRYLNTRAFIDPLRLVRGQPMVDTGYAFQHVARHLVPLDWDEIVRSGIALTIVASRVDGAVPTEGAEPAEPVRLTGFQDLNDLLEALRATSSMPLVAGPPYPYRGMRFWDAAVTEPIPVHSALLDGCTHVLTLETVPESDRLRGLLFVEKLAAHWIGVATRARHMGRSYLASFAQYHRVKELLSQKTGPGDPIEYTIRASRQARRVGITETRRSELVQGGIAGYDSVLRAFGVAGHTLMELIRAVDDRGRPVNARALALSTR